MLQSIMGYGYPPPVDRQKDRHMSKHYLPVVLRTLAVINTKGLSRPTESESEKKIK